MDFKQVLVVFLQTLDTLLGLVWFLSMSTIIMQHYIYPHAFQHFLHVWAFNFHGGTASVLHYLDNLICKYLMHNMIGSKYWFITWLALLSHFQFNLGIAMVNMGNHPTKSITCHVSEDGSILDGLIDVDILPVHVLPEVICSPVDPVEQCGLLTFSTMRFITFISVT